MYRDSCRQRQPYSADCELDVNRRRGGSVPLQSAASVPINTAARANNASEMQDNRELYEPTLPPEINLNIPFRSRKSRLRSQGSSSSGIHCDGLPNFSRTPDSTGRSTGTSALAVFNVRLRPPIKEPNMSAPS